MFANYVIWERNKRCLVGKRSRVYWSKFSRINKNVALFSGGLVFYDTLIFLNYNNFASGVLVSRHTVLNNRWSVTDCSWGLYFHYSMRQWAYLTMTKTWKTSFVTVQIIKGPTLPFNKRKISASHCNIIVRFWWWKESMVST